MSNDWFSRGVDGLRDQQEKQAEERKARSEFDVQRDLWSWYMSAKEANEGAVKKVIFLTSMKNMISTYVHEFPKIPGNWKSGSYRMTCLAKADPTGQTRCPICENTDSYASLRTLLAVIDVTGYTKDNKRFMPVKYILARQKTMESLLMDVDPENGGNGDIFGVGYAVKRLKTDGSSQGDNWKALKQFDLEEFAAQYNEALLPSIQRFPREWGMIRNPDADPAQQQVILKDLPWEHIFAPLSHDEIAEITGLRLASMGSPSPNSTSSKSGSDPFGDASSAIADAEFPDAPF